MSEIYRIEARSHNIAGAFSHNFWALKAPDGRLMSELHGMATDRTSGEPIPIGTTKSHSLRAWLFAPTPEAKTIGVPIPQKATSGLYDSNQKAIEVYSGTSTDVFGKWVAATRGAMYINQRNLDYPSMGVSIFGPTINSNSVFTSLGDLMGLPRTSFEGVAEPGNGNPAVDLEKMKQSIEAYETRLRVGFPLEPTFDAAQYIDNPVPMPEFDFQNFHLEVGPVIFKPSGGGRDTAFGSGVSNSRIPGGRITTPWIEIGGNRRRTRSAEFERLDEYGVVNGGQQENKFPRGLNRVESHEIAGLDQDANALVESRTLALVSAMASFTSSLGETTSSISTHPLLEVPIAVGV